MLEATAEANNRNAFDMVRACQLKRSTVKRIIQAFQEYKRKLDTVAGIFLRLQTSQIDSCTAGPQSNFIKESHLNVYV